ncbi:ribonuclease III domain-containing protein [Aspergillus karnatakaensis]|uniref:ribonuclease III n=1 Tax=Aspergillus karnatakaensis TaxID=1810916 RepID=UPI003CCD60CD
MDRKRKSVFSSHHDDRSPPPTLKKKPFDHSLTRPLFRSPSDSDLENDLTNLRILVEKIPFYFEKYAYKLNPDILRTARDLNRALKDAPLFDKHTTRRIDSDPSPLPERSGSHNDYLPPLPPIMDKNLELAVFTHPGVNGDSKANYDRLEILGDAYIELISTKLICNRFEQIPSGRISQIRELLVKNETLAQFATNYGLDSRACVPQDHSSQQKRWTKVRGDIFEAYVAAVILSHPGGYFVAEAWLSQLWSSKLGSLEESNPNIQFKQILAGKIMGKGAKLRYMDEREYVQHEGGTQTFFVGVYFTGWGWDNQHLGSGQGTNKKVAGNMAAAHALKNEALINEIVTAKAQHETQKL